MGGGQPAAAGANMATVTQGSRSSGAAHRNNPGCSGTLLPMRGRRERTRSSFP